MSARVTSPADHATPATLPAERLESAFEDFKPAFSEPEAEAEANRCINCYSAPCITACPTGIDIPKFIRRIGSGNDLGAARTILDSNILGLSCAQSCPTEVLCEGACVYNHLNQKPIAIGRLQRFAVEKAYDSEARLYAAGPETGKRVALVGAGPASLSCAHELRKLGHEVTLFEKNERLGGLNTSGIAPYKMKAEVSLREIEQVLSIGMKVKTGQELGRNLSLSELLGRFDAVFLGMGLGEDSRLDIPGAEHPRVQGAVQWISDLKSKAREDLSWVSSVRTALIVGGGNTALDACRELRGLGVPRVVVSYRRGEADMSGYAHELAHARQEGVEFWFHTLPAHFESMPIEPEFTGDAAPLRACLRKTRLAPGGKLETLDESTELDVDLVLMATGQAKLQALLGEIPELRFEKGSLQTDPQTGQTHHPKIFAGGDLANGGKEVVNAVAEGKRAAQGIHAALMPGSPRASSGRTSNPSTSTAAQEIQ